MKKNRCISIVLVLALMMCVALQPIASSASSVQERTTISDQERSLSGVALFVGGVLIGYVADGAILYITGHSAAELTASAISKIIKFVKDNPSYEKVWCTSSGGGMGGGGMGDWYNYL